MDDFLIAKFKYSVASGVMYHLLKDNFSYLSFNEFVSEFNIVHINKYSKSLSTVADEKKKAPLGAFSFLQLI